MTRTVWMNGRFVPERDARVSIYDSALQMGDMAFEVTRTCNHVPFRLREHLHRLYRTLDVIHVDPQITLDDLEAITNETIARNLPTEADDVDWNITHHISRGPAGAFLETFPTEERRPTVIVSCFPIVKKMAAIAPLYETGIDLVVAPKRAISPDALDPSMKTRSRVHYQIANFDASSILPGSSAVLLDEKGFLTEGTTGNIFIVYKGKLCTPTSRNILAGVTRQVVLELAQEAGIPAEKCDITTVMAFKASEIFMTSTSIGILHARSFDQIKIHHGAIGPVTQTLRAALTQRVGLDFAAQAQKYRERLESPSAP